MTPRDLSAIRTRAYLANLALEADENIGNTANREGDAYQQGVRDLATALAGLPPMKDWLGIGTLADALEGTDIQPLPLTSEELENPHDYGYYEEN